MKTFKKNESVDIIGGGELKRGKKKKCEECFNSTGRAIEGIEYQLKYREN